MRSTLVLLLFVTASAADVKPAVVREMRSGSMLECAVVLRGSQFGRAAVLSLSKAFLRAHPRESLIRYVIFTDPNDARRYVGGRGSTDWDYPSWQSAYSAESQAPPPMAELLRIGDRAAVRILYSTGKVQESVLQRASPFEFKIDKEVVRIRGVVFHRTSAAPPEVPSFIPSFFVQTMTAWTLKQARELYRVLAKDVGSHWMDITIENGWWFATSTYYPVRNRFVPYVPAPTFDEFKSHTRFYCDGIEGDCVQMGPAKIRR